MIGISLIVFVLPVYSGKQILIDEKRNFSANKSFLFRNRIIPACRKNRLLQIDLNNCKLSNIRF